MMRNLRPLLFIALLCTPLTALTEPQEVAPGVFFRLADGGCNNGWVVFEDYVLVIDANYPQYAEEVLADIRKTTDKPVRFVFDTHHHGDHAFGNNVFSREGAIPVSQQYAYNILLDSTAAYAQWAEGKPAYAELGLSLPSLTFAEELVYDDGTQRVELIYFGHGHTKGDAVAYLPKQKILFTGDLVVNGAYNYMGDSSLASWISILDDLKAMAVETVCPGHGKIAGQELIETQQKYFVQLRDAVQAALRENQPLEQMLQSISLPLFREWTGQEKNEENIRRVYQELTGLVTPHTLDEVRAGDSYSRETADWTAPKKMLVRFISQQQLQELKHVAPEMEFIMVDNNREVLKKIDDADGMVGPISPEMVRQGKNLRWVHSISAGVEGYLFPELVESDIILTNGQGTYGPAIGDHVLGLMIALAKDLPAVFRSQFEGDWDRPTGDQMTDLEGKTVLILGLGGIGKEVAERCAGFNMKILAVDPQSEGKPRYVRTVAPPSAMKELLPQADYVICCVPLTPQTQGYFDRDCFTRMKPSAYFINIARGEVVNQDDLVEALTTGKIAGAGLDVTTPEPLPGDHPLWKMENVIITPHMSGRTQESMERRWHLLRENVRRFANGEKLLNVVDKSKGY